MHPGLSVALLALFLTGSAPALDLSDPVAAERELEGLVAEWQSEWNESPTPDTATQLGLSLQALGTVERQAGQPTEARLHLGQACELLAEHAPAALTDAKESLALTLQDLGRLSEAEALLREVLAKRPQSDPARPNTLDHLGLNLLYQGHYPEVAPLFEEALSSTSPDDHAARARRLGNRAILLHTLGNHSRAVDEFRAALHEPFDDPELRLSLESELALAQLRLGLRKEAWDGLQAAADRARQLYAGKAPFRAVPYLNNLGALALERGDPGEARNHFEEALNLLEAQFGPDHPSLIRALNNLGVALQELGDLDAADTILSRAAELQELHLPPVHLRVAETARNLARNALLQGNPIAPVRVEAATSVGLALLEELVHSGSERERLNFLERFDLVSLPCATGDADRIADVLLASKGRLFDALLRSGVGQPPTNWRELQSALPKGTAFIDTCRYVDPAPGAPGRYGAVVILTEGPPRWVPLGTEESLNRWLGALRERLAWTASRLGSRSGPPPTLKLPTILRALDREFWAPFAKEIPSDVRHIAFSPDGTLHFLPLAALLDSENRPLCLRYMQVTTVASGRDLLAPAPNLPLGTAPWTVLTIDDYPSYAGPAGSDRLTTLLAELQPLPGTRKEAQKLKAIAPRHSRFLHNEAATEAALAADTPSPRVLHLGCHAFFLSDSDPSPGPIDFDQRSDLLFASGLVLDRGTLHQPGDLLLSGSDDLLFPGEIAALPLSETRLVTLSSCESGVGTPVSGEGLLGLRRAFALAGARDVAVALWPVSDRSTPDFMDRFYRLAVASDRPAQALWQAQGEFLSDCADDDAFELAVLRYAPFVISQSGPLLTGNTIHAARSPQWPRWLAFCLAPIPLMIFFIARTKRRSR